MILSILNAIAAIPQIVGYLEQFAAVVTAWYVQRQNTQTKSAIVDAIALDVNAKTDQDRYDAMDALQKALDRGRYISS